MQVSDGLETDSQDLTVTVTDTDETPANLPPEITSDGGGADASITIDENTRQVTTIHATDPENRPIAYAISGGTDAHLFTLDPATGALAFTTAPDYEHPNDADNNNAYEIEITATDGSLTDNQTLHVHIRNLNEPPQGQIPTAISTDEDTAAVVRGEGGRTITLRDPDGKDSDVRVKLSVSQGTLGTPPTRRPHLPPGNDPDSTLTLNGSVADVNDRTRTPPLHTQHRTHPAPSTSHST